MALANLNNCLTTAVKEGMITESAAKDIRDFYAHEVKSGRAREGVTADEIKVMQQLKYDRIRKKNLALMNAQRKEKLVELVNSHPEGPYEGLLSLLTKNITEGAGYSNIQYRAKAIDDMARMELTDAFDALREQWGVAWWTRDQKLNDEVINEIMGVNTANPQAKKFAEQWNKAAEDMRLQFNAAGGDIPKLSSWALPQSHNQFKVAKAGLEKWKNDIRETLDTKAMGIEGDNEALENLLDYVYDSISTGGMNKMEPGKLPKGISSSLANRGQQHRVLHFKDPTGYMSYSKKYGNDDLYTVMSDHLRGMSNDIASMEILGSNPQNMFDFLQDYVKKSDPKMLGSKWVAEGNAQAVFDVATGRVDSTYSGTAANIAMARGFGAFRSANVAGKLGGAVISSITDLGGMILTARYNDLPAMKMMYNGFKNMVRQDRIKTGAKIGHGMNSWNGTSASRFSEAGDVNSFMDKAADKVLRASGLSLWTEGFRKAFSMEFSATLAENFKFKFSELPKNMQKNMGRYGIDSAKWDKIRTSAPISADGIDYLDPKSIMNLKGIDKAEARELTINVMEMIKSETDMAVIEPDARVRAWTTGGGQKGTIQRELQSTATQFKSFPLAVMFTHLKRGMAQQTMGGKFAYMSSYMGLSVGLGALAVQGKELAKGREPIAMDTPKFWAAAGLQGGGLGIFGDFVFSDVNRFGGSFTDTLVGPLGQLTSDSYNLTLGLAHEAFDPEKEINTAKHASTIKSYIPSNNLWYTRLLFNKVFDEAVSKQVDPNFERKLRSREAKRKKEWGNENWYK